LNERREFFQSTIGRLLHEIADRAERRVAPKRWFRPPGAASEVAFLAACTRCGDCIDVCPVHAILKMPANDGGLATGTPYIDPATRACVVCPDMPCAAACETGALTKVPWESVHMGVLELDRSAASRSRERNAACARGPAPWASARSRSMTAAARC